MVCITFTTRKKRTLLSFLKSILKLPSEAFIFENCDKNLKLFRIRKQCIFTSQKTDHALFSLRGPQCVRCQCIPLDFQELKNQSNQSYVSEGVQRVKVTQQLALGKLSKVFWKRNSEDFLCSLCLGCVDRQQLGGRKIQGAGASGLAPELREHGFSSGSELGKHG